MRMYDEATALARIGAWQCDLETEELTWTNGVYDLFGLPRGSRLERSRTVELYHDESRVQMQRLRAATIAGAGAFSLEARICTPEGENRWMRLSADVEMRDGRPVRLFGAKQDITREREMLDRLRDMAERDPLTGLANRTLFQARFHERQRSEAADVPVSALVLIDLDHFKQINDGYGHAAGDECLRQFAGRLRRAFPEASLIARIGGDEFALLLRHPVRRGDLARALGTILTRLCRPVLCGAHSIRIGASIGATVADLSRPFDSVRLFAEADSMLYAAKDAGRSSAQMFDIEAGLGDGMNAAAHLLLTRLTGSLRG